MTALLPLVIAMIPLTPTNATGTESSCFKMHVASVVMPVGAAGSHFTGMGNGVVLRSSNGLQVVRVDAFSVLALVVKVQSCCDGAKAQFVGETVGRHISNTVVKCAVAASRTGCPRPTSGVAVPFNFFPKPFSGKSFVHVTTLSSHEVKGIHTSQFTAVMSNNQSIAERSVGLLENVPMNQNNLAAQVGLPIARRQLVAWIDPAGGWPVGVDRETCTQNGQFRHGRSLTLPCLANKTAYYQ